MQCVQSMAVIVATEGFAFLEGFHSMHFLHTLSRGYLQPCLMDSQGRLGEVSLPMVHRSGSSRDWFHTQAPSASGPLGWVL